MTRIEELIKKYDIRQYNHLEEEGYVYEDKILVCRPNDAKRDGVVEEIRDSKPEILAYLIKEREEEKRKYDERKRKIAAIEGLEELQNAIEDLNEWHREFNKSFDDVGGMGVRPYPKYDLEAMYKKYPAAKAYLTAKEYELKSNDELGIIGSKALERIIENPDNYKKIMDDMEKELHDFRERHLWD